MNKKLFSIIFLLLFLKVGYSDLIDNLVSYYDFDETTGTTAYDKLFLYNGTNDGVLINQAGILGKSYYYDGNDEVLISNPTITDKTINFWQKVEGTGLQDLSCLISKGTSDANSIQMRLQNGNEKWLLSIDGTHVEMPTNTVENIWKMITIIKNATHTRFYVNGVQDVIVGNVYSGGNMRLGSNVVGDRFITGYIDELAIFDDEISDLDILNLYNDGEGWEYPFSTPTINDYNISNIFDNSSYHYYLFNSTSNLIYNGYDINGTIANWTNALTVNISAFNYSSNITSGESVNILLNESIDYFDVFVFNPLNTSQNATFRNYIINTADYLGLIYNNTNIIINNTDIIINNTDLILNYTIEINDTLNTILNNTNIIYDEVNYLSRIWICSLKQYESIDEYNYYCKDWNPFNPFSPSMVKTQKEVELNITAYLLNETMKDYEEVSYEDIINDCFSFNSTTYLYLTPYPIINYGLLTTRITIESVYCYGRAFFKIFSGVKFND